MYVRYSVKRRAASTTDQQAVVTTNLSVCGVREKIFRARKSVLCARAYAYAYV